MKPLRITAALTLLVAALAVGAGQAWAAKLPMPPTFSVDADPVTVLKDYPLGVLTRQAVFAHHGQPDKKVILPNGNRAWVYRVRMRANRQTYHEPNGSEQTLTETREGSRRMRYTVEFDSRGIVTDVLYNEVGPHNGLSAVQVQAAAEGSKG
ncbi:MAG TPA: hypothetical protein VKA50_14495 [Gammaproteobacteria bacterium]|nr:hypothetical protein [Gammaproteobacteria bacterium]